MRHAEPAGRTARPVQSGERDMRYERPRFGRDADAATRLVDFMVKARQRLGGFHPRPQRVHHVSPHETAGARDPRRKRGAAQPAKRGADVLRAMAIDLTDVF